MSNKRVLVIGATGQVGRHLVTALQLRGHSVHALIRPRTLAAANHATVSELARRGVVLHEGSLEDARSLADACRGAQVVISAVCPGSIELQANLLAAIDEVGGVERFVPSDFSLDPAVCRRGRVSQIDRKREFQRLVRASRVPFTFVHANCLAEAWADTTSPAIWGDDAPASVITTEDLARFVAATVDDPRTFDRAITIVGPTTTRSSLLAHRERTGRAPRIERVHLSEEALDERIAKASPEDRAHLELVRAVRIDGAAARRSVGTADALDLYPAITPESTFAFLDRVWRRRGALPGSVRRYIDALRSADPSRIADAFGADAWIDHPTDPSRGVTGRRAIAASYEELFDRADEVAVRVADATIGTPDADGVTPCWLDVAIDVHRSNGTVRYLGGVMIAGATEDRLRWGRSFVRSVQAVVPARPRTTR